MTVETNPPHTGSGRPRLLHVDPDRPEQFLLAEAAALLKAGGVLAYPTETFYGLGADAANDAAIERIFLLKGRTATNPLPVIVGAERDLASIAVVDETSRKLIAAFWPGPLTLVLPAVPGVSAKLTANSGRIGIRISSNPIAAGLARALGRPITATSANPSGGPERTGASDVIRDMGGHLDAVIDGGITPGGAGSTILDMTRTPFVVIREGIIPVPCLREVAARTS